MENNNSSDTAIVTNIHHGYVKFQDGSYAVQIPCSESRWGFYLAIAEEDESCTYDGGFGLAEAHGGPDGFSWIPVEPVDVPQVWRECLSWLLDE